MPLPPMFIAKNAVTAIKRIVLNNSDPVAFRVYLQGPRMYPALAPALARAYPAAGALVLFARDSGAGRAAQRPVALRVEGVDFHPVKRQILPDLPLLPDEYWVQLHEPLVALLDLFIVRARPSFGAAQA